MDVEINKAEFVIQCNAKHVEYMRMHISFRESELPDLPILMMC